jgi:N-acetylglutamate synthase-like GNAT family acetyltransferase
MSFRIRPATKRDRAAIKGIIRATRLNPFGLDWRRFLVAEEEGRVVGVGQVKTHRDGSRELASLAVIRGRRGKGIGGELVRALQQREAGPLHLMCRPGLESYYQRLGFHRLEEQDMPPLLRLWYHLMRFLTPVVPAEWQAVIMRWEGIAQRDD